MWVALILCEKGRKAALVWSWADNSKFQWFTYNFFFAVTKPQSSLLKNKEALKQLNKYLEVLREVLNHWF